MKRRIISMLLALAMIMGMIVLPAPAVQAEETDTSEHIHCICGSGTHDGVGDHVCDSTQVWTVWTDSTSLPKSGYYYLDTDVTLSAVHDSGAGNTLNLCLNGHTIYGPESNRTFIVRTGLNLTDCSEKESWGGVVARSDIYGNVFYMYDHNGGSVVNVFAGNYSHSMESIKNTGGLFYLGNQNKGTCVLNLYDANVYGANCTNLGGAIYTQDQATVNMYGGTVTGGTGSAGGNIYISKGTFNLYDGVISNGTANNGANLYCSTGTLNLMGGEITGGKLTGGAGGGVVVGAGVTATLSGDIRITGNDTSNLYTLDHNTVTVGDLTEGAYIGFTDEEMPGAVSTNADLTEDVLNYVYADNAEAYVTVESGKLALRVFSEDYYTKVSQMTVFDSTVDQALPMTITHKLVMEHMNGELAEGKTEKKVILIGYDGFRADALENIADMENSAIMHVAEQGGLYHSFAGGVNKEQQTATAAGWSTILTGGWVNYHGVSNNNDTIDAGIHTFLTALAEVGYEAAYVGNSMDPTLNTDGVHSGWFLKKWAADVAYGEENQLPITYTQPGEGDGEDADTVAYMTELLAQTDIPDVIFSYIEQPDIVGHASGYGNMFSTYISGVQRTDAWGYEIVKAIEARPTYETEDWLIILTTDHGGVFENHGAQTNQERMTWISTSKPIDVTDEANLNYARSHSHCLCVSGEHNGVGGHSCDDSLVWTAWNDSTSLPTSGNYYLNCDVVLTEPMGTGTTRILDVPVGKTLNLCLNGHTISNELADSCLMWVRGHLNITDCQKDAQGNYKGTITGLASTTADSLNAGLLYLFTNANATTYPTSSISIYGGNLISTGTAASTTGGVIRVGNYANAQQGSLNLYDGVISGGYAKNGGNIYVLEDCVFNMYGGEIYGNTATTNGGGVYCAGGTVNIHGGQIYGNEAKASGGGIFCESGTVNFNGGVIRDNTAENHGGNVYINTNAVANIQDVTITGGVAVHGGSFNTQGTVNMYGGTVSGGITHTAAGEGGNVRIGTNGVWNMYGGEVKDGGFDGSGNVICSKGGNFQVYGTVNLYGGTVSGGKSNSDGGNISLWGGKLNMLESEESKSVPTISGGWSKTFSNVMVHAASGSSAQLNMTCGIITGGTSVNNRGSVGVNAGTVSLSGTARITGNEGGNLYLYAGKTVTLGELAEGAKIGIMMQDPSQAFAVAEESAAAYFESDDAGMYVTYEDGSLYLKSAAAVNGTYYLTVQEAVDAANGGVVKLLASVTEDVVISGDVYLNLNGYTLTGDVSGDGTLYGMDSTTDDYDCADMGSIVGTVSCKVAGSFKTDITGETLRYMAIKSDTGYSFHRFYLGITTLSLQPSVTGFGYKAEFYGDAMVQGQLSSMGYSLWLTEDAVVTRSTNEFKNTLTLRLKNFDVANYGETPVNAKVTMTLLDGTVIESEVSSYSMRQVVEAVAANFDSYETARKQAVKTMCEAYATMSDWDISNILTWTDET